MIQSFNKAPDEVLDYVADFSKWMSPADVISAATATIVNTQANACLPLGPTPAAVDHITHDTQTVTTWVKLGNTDDTADVTVQITTTMGRVKDHTFRLRIRASS